MSTRSTKRSQPRARLPLPADLDAREIDRIYGLEPVFDPSKAEEMSPLGEFVQIQCPWCSETLDLSVDLTTADRAWIEDCQVCCRPMQIAIKLDEAGAIRSISSRRDD